MVQKPKLAVSPEKIWTYEMLSRLKLRKRKRDVELPNALFRFQWRCIFLHHIPHETALPAAYLN